MRVSVETTPVRALRGVARTIVVAAVSLAVAVPAAWAGGKRQVPELRRDVETRLARPAAALARISIAVHVTMRDGRPIGDLAAFERAWLRANALLRPHGMEVEVTRVDTVPIDARVHDLHARRLLARYAPPGPTIHVFIVETLERDHALSFRNPVRGLYWRSSGLGWIRGRHWIAVSNGAPTTTLAHELGHLLGLRHYQNERNVMCSCRDGADIRFLPIQGTQMRSNARMLAQDPDAALNWPWHRRRLYRVER